MVSLPKILALLGAFISAGTLVAHAQTRPDTFGIERGTGAVICTNDGDENTENTDDPSYAIAAMWDQMVLGASAACGEQLTPLDNGTWGESKPFTAADNAGLAADFRLYVLHDSYTWANGSDRQVLNDGEPVMFNEILKTPQFFQRFCSAKAVLSVGTASQGGPTAVNHRLARERGRIVASALKSYRPDCTTQSAPVMYALSLGQHRGDRQGDRATQRRVVIVAAEDLAIGVNLEQALRRGLDEQNVFGDMSVVDYDQFDLISF
ncbi:MAG: hypothetical protein AAGJ85_02515 [Pseudomonadota bacterium]